MEQAEILTRLRKEKGLSQTEAAEELGVTRQAISKWESGRAFPSMEKLIALSRLYGVPLEELYVDNTEQGMEARAEIPLESERENRTKRGRSRKTVILFSVLAVLYLSVYIWGIITNSRGIATINLFYLTAILLTAVFLYGTYRVMIYLVEGRGTK